MPTSLPTVLALLLGCAISCGCSRAGESASAPRPSADPREAPSEAEDGGINRPLWLTELDVDAGEPAACFDGAGRLWVAWLQFANERATLEFACVDVAGPDGALHESPILARGTLAPAAEGLGTPCLMALGDGLLAAWETRADGRQRLQARTLHWADGAPVLGALEEVAEGGLEPSGVALDDGRAALAWQAPAGGAYDVFTAVRDAEGWSAPRNASRTALDEWAPRLAAAPGGRFWVTWDVFVEGSFDVVLQGPCDGRADADVASWRAFDGPGYSAFARPAVDERGRVWVACETAEDFGRGGSLRAPRAIELVCFEDGQRRPARLPLAPDEDHQLPRLAATPDGLLLSTRASAQPGNEPGEDSRRARRPKTYSAWATQLHGLDAAAPASLEQRRTIGGNEESSVLLPAPAGPPLLVFSADDRVRFFGSVTAWRLPIERPWRIGVLRADVVPGWPELGPPEPPAPAPGPAAERGNPAPVDGWLFGDLHRHSHLSRCSGDQDGLRVDTYRYALGPGALDFVALADHFQHLTGWSWWRSLRDVERFHLPPRLITLAGIERKVVDHGHQNLIYQEPADAAADPPAWSQLHAPGLSAVEPPRVTAIPHMTSSDDNPFPVADLDLRLHRVVELYQGLRGAYEGPGLPLQAHDLVDGDPGARRLPTASHPLGWIGSTDHSESGDGLAVLRTNERSRAGVMQAIARRATLAATARAAVAVRIGELRGGQVGAVPADAPVRLEIVSATAPVAYVELVRGGETVRREAPASDPSRERVQLTLQRKDATPEHPIQLTVSGGRIVEHAIRHGERAGAGVRARSATELDLWTGPVGCDLVLVLERDGGELPLVVRADFEDKRGELPVGSLALGRSESIPGLQRRDFLWRLGPPRLPGEPPRAFSLPSPGWAEGDSIYARVAFEDGNLVWTSPIFVSATTE